MINQTIKKAIKENSDEMISIRRKLHSEPELSWEEFQTSQFVYDYLTELGIEARKMEPTGVVAELKGDKVGKTVALRADMDALSVEELNTDLAYKSKELGKMHACGHDVHTAMLLTAAKALVSVKEEIPGNVRFIFQPAEEVATGAKAMVDQGAVKGVDNAFGIHIWSQSETGKIACSPGPAFASADIFKVHFKGQGGHGAMPQDCIDAAIIASSFVMNVQSVVSRTVDPQQSAVVTIGKMVVGTRFNIIAENADIEGTVRCFDPTTRDHIEKQLKIYADHTAAIYGGSAEVEYIRGTQAVINGEESAQLVQEVAMEAFGEDSLYVETPTMGGEDFSFYLDEVPGSFALVGSGNPQKDTQWAHHHGKFNVDEDSMATGAELYAQYAWAFLTK
ncbi:carboxypeptidase, putative [Planococcus donghaensis MPA1U2]|uniref:Carboxypeptidase, putative n=1 Tax=Planococcus donghaensis MPA1U2 TaxID=933115 RepID=E7RKW1_9BACL|nr:amidohydrolase [Planococcus donghaensis]EGA88355.1 carboxypeptidase, putative [Planococcus donghaensis MPA1U2]